MLRGWRGYGRVTTLSYNVCAHNIVILAENSTNPNDDEIHTQRVEAMEFASNTNLDANTVVHKLC